MVRKRLLGGLPSRLLQTAKRAYGGAVGAGGVAGNGVFAGPPQRHHSPRPEERQHLVGETLRGEGGGLWSDGHSGVGSGVRGDA